MDPRFEFFANVEKAHTPEGGLPHVVAIASDTTEDQHGDRMSELAIQMMAKQSSEDEIDLLKDHRSSFSIGHTTGGVVEKETDRSLFKVEFELDSDYPEAMKLYKEAGKAKQKYQLSIGGFVPLDDPEALLWEAREDGSIRRVINKIRLDHIAVTRMNHAANKNTGFRSAVMKALDEIPEPIMKKEDLLAVTEGLLKDQRDESSLTLTPAQVKSAANRLISQYVVLDIAPPLGLLQLSKGTFGKWSAEAEGVWELYKQTILDNSKEINSMANEEVKTEKEVFNLTKSVTELKAELPGILSDAARKAELQGFMNELLALPDMGAKAEVKEEVVGEDKKETVADIRDAYFTHVDAALKANSKDPIEALKAETVTALEKQVITLKGVIEEVIKAELKAALESFKSDVTAKLDAVDKRLKTVEEIEGASATEEVTKESEDPDGGLWDGLFTNAVNCVRSAKFSNE